MQAAGSEDRSPDDQAGALGRQGSWWDIMLATHSYAAWSPAERSPWRYHVEQMTVEARDAMGSHQEGLRRGRQEAWADTGRQMEWMAPAR